MKHAELHESSVAQSFYLPLQLIFPLLHLEDNIFFKHWMIAKFTFLFLRMIKAQMKMLMASMMTPMATTMMESLSMAKPSEGKSTWGPGVKVMFPLLKILN